MTSLAQVKAAINGVISQINEQNGLINDFKSTNRDNMTLVTRTLQGGQAGHEQTMLTALRRADDSLSKAQQALRQAEQSAKKVTNI
ncbi:hypothetical protein HMPREF2883_10290 [Actinomyces sp. HMSC075C01]|uniref:Uncharacterized protein n=1 Tax=Actinomyces oris TaxID=544580 RepID=A0A1Q8VZ26_9ACTO|nr:MULTISPECIES: hypothetical protein [Actinomyces]OFR48149.1 hypothetical protein HMPREF2883_10290 [Actinomyces sp. HMSC075C01]OLO53829.1 hypothetical protein BKH27_05095 [Actinomyces oris]